MTKVTIVGSGPAAAAATLALRRQGRCEIEILDVGQRLESERAELLAGVSTLAPPDWPLDARRELSRQPSAPAKGELPQKWLFGSDFPFRDAGQLEAITVESAGNRLSVSGAFGGFSNSWGAQVMPFSGPTLDAWPIGYQAMLPHYAAILEHLPFAGADDDYSEWFPLFVDADPLPSLAPPVAAVLRRYGARREAIRRRGVTLGQARLAIDARRCTACGLCLTGCPSRLIYTSSHTLAPLIREGGVRYRDGVLVLRVGEDDHGCWIELRDLASGRLETVRTNRVLLACGGLGTTRVALRSVRPATRRVTLQEAVQVVLPFLSATAHPDPRNYSTFTLNQFNMLVQYGRAGLDLAQMHLYPFAGVRAGSRVLGHKRCHVPGPRPPRGAFGEALRLPL